MSFQILLAIPDPMVAADVAALAGEGSELDVIGTAHTADELALRVGRAEPDAVVIHEDLGPMPVMDVARDLAGTHPHVAFVLVARDVTPDLLRASLQSGIRDVLGLPLTLEALEEGVRRAASFSQALRERIDDDGFSQAAERVGGRLVVVAGAKGGVGTTMLAVQLALASTAAGGETVTCLVDLDLQKGDLRSLLDIPSRRSVLDLGAVSEDLATRSLDETLYVHHTGLRVLLAPEHGELAEDLTESATRRILGALKFQYDLVVVDVGAVVSESGAMAVEMADEVLLVTTPDVPALRAANRLIGLWERLNARGDDVRVVLNQISRENEIQLDLARKVLTRPVAERTLPAAFRELEPVINTGHPERLAGGLQRAVVALAQEVGVISPAPERRRLRLRAETGQTTVEFAGLAGLIFMLAFVLWQFALLGYTFVLAGHSARAGARAQAVGAKVEDAARKPVTGAWRHGMTVTVSADKRHVKSCLPMPVIVPGVDVGIDVCSTQATVVEDQPLPDALRDTPARPTPASP